jgi:hypothetical protein
VDAEHEVTVTPASVLIAGPEQHVSAVASALTDPVDAGRASSGATFTGVHVYVTDPLVRVMRPAAVTLTLTTNGQHSAVNDQQK